MTTDPTRPPELGRPRKLAEQIAAQVEQEISELGWPVGTLIGSEASFAEKYGASRAVVREAVRLLEQHGVVAPRRGMGGGLAVARPEISAVLPAIAIYLDSEGVTPETLLEARSAIELPAVALAAERITDERRERLLAAFEREQQELDDPHKYVLSHELHILIAELSGNAALKLFVAVLTRLSSEHAREGFAKVKRAKATDIGRDISHAHARIVDAIAAGNAPLAQRRMLAHLRAITPWLT